MILEAIDSHTGNRSAYIADLVEKDLRSIGKIPGTEESALVTRFVEMIRRDGKAAAAARLGLAADQVVSLAANKGVMTL
jgi:hypothetical protein